jgi:hypothetical protein
VASARVAAVLCALWAAGHGPGAAALEIERLDVSYADGRYRMEAVAEVGASPQTVFAILTDYDRLDLLDSKVLESRLLERPAPNVALVWMRVRGCIAFVICRELKQVDRVEERAPTEILVTLVPERSDLELENARWQIESSAEGAKLRYVLEMEPGSWVPFFGRSSVERQLRAGFRNALAAIERLAVEREPGP